MISDFLMMLVTKLKQDNRLQLSGQLRKGPNKTLPNLPNLKATNLMLL